jgi:hypothetical protein
MAKTKQPTVPSVDPPPAETQRWAPGRFAANTRALIRRLQAWPGVDPHSPFRRLPADDPQVILTNRRTFRESVRPFISERQPCPGLRIAQLNPEHDSIGIHEPNRDSDKSLTLWLLGEYGLQLTTAPTTLPFDYLRGLFDQLLDSRLGCRVSGR